MLISKATIDKIDELAAALDGNEAGLGLAVDVDKGKITELHLSNGAEKAPVLVVPLAMVPHLADVAERLRGVKV